MTLTRGKKHTIPRNELDIQQLQESYRKARVHVYEPRRKIAGKRDNAKDITTNGALTMMSGSTLANWVDGRSFTRSTTEGWDLFSDSNDSDDTASDEST